MTEGWYNHEEKMAKMFPPPKWTQVKWNWMADPEPRCTCHDATWQDCPDAAKGPDPGVMHVLVPTEAEND